MKCRVFYLVFIILVCSWVTHAQQLDSISIKSDDIKVVFKIKDDHVILRWAPANPKVWLQNPYAKVLIRKHSWDVGNFDVNTEPVLISDTLSVWSEEKFETLPESQKNNELLMLAGYCMYAPYESIGNDEGLNLKSIADRQQELTNRYSSALFAADRSVEAATALNMYFIDKDADLEKVNVYIVEMHTPEGEIYVDKTVYFPGEQYDCNVSIDKWSEEEEMVVLSWNRKKHEKCFSAYWIERSADNVNFERLNDVPYVHAFDINQESTSDDFIYFDSVSNYVPYYYRIIGLDAFGDESIPSKSVRLMGKDRTPPSQIENGMAEMYLDQYMNITWEWDQNDQDLRGFIIRKSEHREGPFDLISQEQDINIRSYKDVNPNYFGANYYQVCVVDTASNYSCSTPIYGFLLDTIPPSKPQGLKGEIDTLGIVTLAWDKGLERDIYGYNIYFSNRHDGVFSILNTKPVNGFSYKDTITLNSLTHNVFYKIVAVDHRDNLSPFSNMVQLMKPDTIPPGCPLFKEYKNNDNEVEISWVNSSSNDVKAHYLLRKDKEGFDTIAIFRKGETNYVDNDVKSQIQYHYRIAAQDYSLNVSNCPRDLAIKTGFHKPQTSCELKISKSENERLIVCSIDDLKEVKRCIIYRSIDQGPFLIWKTLLNDFSQELKDKDKGEEIKYKARLVYKSGLKSDYFIGLLQ